MVYLALMNLKKVGISQPTDFDNAVTPVIPNCSDCPSGYTLVPSADAWIVARPLSSTTDLHDATAQAAFLATLVAAYGTLYLECSYRMKMEVLPQ
jgi:hypothetical protein